MTANSRSRSGKVDVRWFEIVSKKIDPVTRIVSFAALSLVMGGCSFIARSPDQYRDDTSTLLATKAAELNSCFDDVLKTTPGLSGKVTLRFSVERKTGKIVNAVADPSRTTAPQPLIDCVITSLSGLMLSPPDQRNGDATFEYEFAGPKPATPPQPQ